jgi:hypothetical protein
LLPYTKAQNNNSAAATRGSCVIARRNSASLSRRTDTKTGNVAEDRDEETNEIHHLSPQTTCILAPHRPMKRGVDYTQGVIITLGS